MTTTTTTKTTTDLEQFYNELLKDSVLQERLKAATDPESLLEIAVELGKEKGYLFTREELLAAMAIESFSESLSVEELYRGVKADSCIVCDVCYSTPQCNL